MWTLEGFCTTVPLGFLTDRRIGEAGEEIATICIQPIEKTCALSDILRGGLIIGLGFGVDGYAIPWQGWVGASIMVFGIFVLAIAQGKAAAEEAK